MVVSTFRANYRIALAAAVDRREFPLRAPPSSRGAADKNNVEGAPVRFGQWGARRPSVECSSDSYDPFRAPLSPSSSAQVTAASHLARGVRTE